MVKGPTFTEHGPNEKGFGEVFARQIAPKLEELERERLTLSSQRKYRLLVTIAATAVGAIITIVLMSASWNVDEPNERFVKLITFSLFPLFSAIAGAWWVKKLQNIHVASLRGVIADAACRFFDDLAYYRDPGEQFDHTRFFQTRRPP